MYHKQTRRIIRFNYRVRVTLTKSRFSVSLHDDEQEQAQSMTSRPHCPVNAVRDPSSCGSMLTQWRVTGQMETLRLTAVNIPPTILIHQIKRHRDRITTNSRVNLFRVCWTMHLFDSIQLSSTRPLATIVLLPIMNVATERPNYVCVSMSLSFSLCVCVFCALKCLGVIFFVSLCDPELHFQTVWFRSCIQGLAAINTTTLDQLLKARKLPAHFLN